MEPSGVKMDDTVQGGPKRSARKNTGIQERLDTPGGPTISTLARPDALQAAWNDGDRILTRQTRQDEKGGPQPVLVVRLAAEHPSRAGLDRLAHEYGLRDELDSAWAAKPLGFIKDNGRSALVLEDCGGVPLRQLIGEREHGMAAELPLFLRLAIGIAAAVGKAHERGLIHRDIKPANILVNEADGEVRLTGFGVASRLFRERQAPEPPEVIGGTLAYMAPEQTGRMNRSVNSRSDLYAVGVTFYEMLTGRLPFAASDPIEWVHCHIARRPVPPSERMKKVPRGVSAIVMKLLAKDAEERYQTAAGLEADLRRALTEWEGRGRIGELPSGLTICRTSCSFLSGYTVGSARLPSCLPASTGLLPPAGRADVGFGPGGDRQIDGRERTPPRARADARTVCIGQIRPEPARRSLCELGASVAGPCATSAGQERSRTRALARGPD